LTTLFATFAKEVCFEVAVKLPLPAGFSPTTVFTTLSQIKPQLLYLRAQVLILFLEILYDLALSQDVGLEPLHVNIFRVDFVLQVLQVDVGIFEFTPQIVKLILQRHFLLKSEIFQQQKVLKWCLPRLTSYFRFGLFAKCFPFADSCRSLRHVYDIQTVSSP
jgi:hypothetical protein